MYTPTLAPANVSKLTAQVRQARTIETRLARLAQARKALADTEADLVQLTTEVVREANAAGVSYADIGLALGVSKARARELARIGGPQ